MNLFELFYTFFKIGLFTFGGGYAMIPLITEQVTAHGWMDMEQLINFIAVSESTPGPFALNIATFIGTETQGVLGALCATLGVVLPSFIIILIVAKFYLAFKKSKPIQGAMSGLRPAALGMIASAVISVGATVFFPEGISLGVITSYSFIVSAVIFALMAFLGLKKKIHPILLIGISAVLGIVSGYISEVI